MQVVGYVDYCGFRAQVIKKIFGLASIGVHFLVVLQFSRNTDAT